jgi:hypothetical protein
MHVYVNAIKSVNTYRERNIISMLFRQWWDGFTVQALVIHNNVLWRGKKSSRDALNPVFFLVINGNLRDWKGFQILIDLNLFLEWILLWLDCLLMSLISY